MAYKSRTLPKESHTIPLEGNKDRGDGLDYKRWYRCWNCGWICDIDRDALGDGESLSGEGYADATAFTDPSIDNMGVLGGEDAVISLELGADGQPKEILHHLQSVISSGCPFCGSLNWLGKY